MGRIGLAALVMGVVGGSGAVGCAGERDPINRTQPGAYDKAFFVGESLEDPKDDPEFRTKSYNIDSAANTESFSGTIGGSSAVDRIRWDVQEGWLLARRSYQESPGADNKGLPRKEVSPGKWEFEGKPDGTIIAAYRILSHFDIRRDYNAQTGEEGNVIVENTTDRPWNQRQYMRVDWSQNLAQSTSGDINWLFGAGSMVTPIQYAVTNEQDVDYPKFDIEGGYFDITAKYQLNPEPMPGWGVPECLIVGFFNGSASFDCSPTEVKVRHSFVRLTGEEDFEPFEESRAQRDVIGNWGNAGSNFQREYGAPPITAWDPQYGYTDAKTKTFYALHNIWEKSHQQVACSDNADEDRNGTADACENSVTGYAGVGGSQCDIHMAKCTIPVRDRKVKTIGYWLNAEAPQELLDEVSEDGKTITRMGAIEETTRTWNQLFKVSVATRREVECRRTGEGTREECHAQFFEGEGPDAKEMVGFGGWGIDKVKPQAVDMDDVDGKKIERLLVTTCHNPVRAYDPSMCGKPGEVIRLGDLRKNYEIYWPYASRAPYGGVATIGADPLTGEMVGVTATTMMRSVTAASAQVRDILQLAMGDVKVEELIEGAQASRFADLVKNGKLSTEFGAKPKTAQELATLVKNAQAGNVASALGASAEKVRALPKLERQLARAKQDMMTTPMAPSIVKENERAAALLSQLDKSEYRPEIQNRGLHRILAAAQDKSSPAYRALSDFAANDPTRIQDLLDNYQAYLGNKGVCFADAINNAGAGSIYLPQLAPYFKQLYADLDAKERGARIYLDLQREIVKGIAFHEVGHSLGMRHNFSSSWDSANYLPQYWQLRTAEGQATAACDPKQPRTGATDSCLGPRYLDPMTDDENGMAGEARPGIEYFANTSTMEYQIERFGETAGAGTYDLHFTKTLYGRVLETFDANQVKPEDQTFFAVKMLSQGINDELVFDPDGGFGMHYTKAAMKAKVFDANRDCRPATDEEKAHAKWRIVHGKVCSPSPKNHLAYDDMKSEAISFKLGGQSIPVGVNGVRWKGRDENGVNLVRWHYRYGEDYSRGGYMHAKMMDSGADVYEITVNTIKRFDLTYPWTYFRRLNKEFAWWSIPYSVAANTFSRLRGYHWNTTTDIGRADAAALESDDQDRPNVIAAAEMFNFLQRVILMPEPGIYGNGANTQRRTPKRPGAMTIFDIQEESEQNGTPVANLGIVDARYIQVDFDNDRGGSWDYFHFPRYTGFDEEKVLAIREMVDARPTLSTVSRDNALDGREPMISFRTDTPAAIDRLLGSIMAEDWETIGPSADAEGKMSNFQILDPDSSKLTRPANAKVLFPNMGYSNELGSSIYALLFSRYASDMTLSNKLRIRYENDNGPIIPEAKKIAFTDPTTGIRYIATRFGTETINGRAVETGIGSRMLQRANELLTATYQTTGVAANGEPIVAVDAGGKPIVIGNATTQLDFRRYVGLLDGVRQVGNILGGGPLGGGGGGDD